MGSKLHKGKAGENLWNRTREIADLLVRFLTASGRWDPCLDEAAIPRCTLDIPWVVDDVIQQFWWEGGIRHRGHSPTAIDCHFASLLPQIRPPLSLSTCHSLATARDPLLILTPTTMTNERYDQQTTRHRITNPFASPPISS